MKVLVKLDVFLEWLNRMLSYFSATVLVLLGLTITINAITRVFYVHFAGLLDFARISLLWIGVGSVSWLMRKDGHLVVDVVTSQVSRRTAAMMDVVTCGICAVVFGILAWYAFDLALTHQQRGYFLADAMLPINKAWAEAIIPLAWTLLTIELLRKMVRRWRDWKETGTR